MQVRNEGEWQHQMSEFTNDPDPMARHFSEFVVHWADRSEALLGHAGSAIEALRATLRQVEEEKGPLSIGFLGMALVVLCSHWSRVGEPEEFFASMNPIEQNLFQDVVSVKLEEMSLSAAQTGDTEDWHGHATSTV